MAAVAVATSVAPKMTRAVPGAACRVTGAETAREPLPARLRRCCICSNCCAVKPTRENYGKKQNRQSLLAFAVGGLAASWGA